MATRARPSGGPPVPKRFTTEPGAKIGGRKTTGRRSGKGRKRKGR